MTATARKRRDFSGIARTIGALWITALERADQLTEAQSKVFKRFASEMGEDFCYVGHPAGLIDAGAGAAEAQSQSNAWNWLIENRHIVNIGGDLYCLELADEQLEFLRERCEEIAFDDGIELLDDLLN